MCRRLVAGDGEVLQVGRARDDDVVIGLDEHGRRFGAEQGGKLSEEASARAEGGIQMPVVGMDKCPD